MLAALDVFSGIGGFARALQGIATTKVFCDINPKARECLRANMERGLLEKASIHEDIRTLKGSKDIDLIAAGIPCLGFSPLGLKHGFDHVETNLFYELMRLVDECDPSLIFMENVPNIILHGMHTIVDELHCKRGYDLTWLVLPAYAVGAFHTRHRWFCVARKPDLKALEWKDLSFERHVFDVKDPPPRMVMRDDPLYMQRSKRCFLLGNSIVPCVARLAFFLLISGFTQGDITAPTLKLEPLIEGLKVPLDIADPAFKFPRWGGVDAKMVYSIPQQHFERPDLDLTLLQRHPLEVLLTERVTSKVLKMARLRLWSTPRAGMVGTSQVLTERSSRDLPTQVKFEVGTPEAMKKGQLNPEWVEVVLMGYPRGFTAVPM